MDAAFADVMHPACEIVTPSGTHTGSASMAQYGQTLFRAFPDMVHRVVHAVQAGEWVAAEVRITGTHDGPLAMPSGVLPASGRRIDYTVANFCQFKDGRLIRIRQYHDRMELLAQLGLLDGS